MSNARLIPFEDLSLVTILPIMHVRYLSDYAMNYLALERKRKCDIVFHTPVCTGRSLSSVMQQKHNKSETGYRRNTNIQRVLRQGDPLSAKIFNCVLEEIFRKIQRTIGRDAERFVGRKHGIAPTTNTSKTKVLNNDANGQMIVNNANIEFVTQCIYLDQTISFQNSMDKEIDRRIASAWKKVWSMSFILMDKSQKLQNKRQIFNSCIAPVLLYGAQSWSLTKKQTLKLGRCQRRMERKILGISLKDRVRNEEVRRRSGIEDVVTLANRMKWRWEGRVVRMQRTRWAYTATLWDPRIG
ncbi:hypothetical protein ANN_23467 [Periplaneta americana]|uniref:Reverse transcriptase domain-containing protein n=1 Tax=Periplaneta americana TaxID=6978 RepID=A0ABQ8SM87_PERAM|nr:hypothetical protein ANN_23467 [Periplaneta americana]